MYYQDGSVYEGEWLEDKRHGRGVLRLGQYKYQTYTNEKYHTMHRWREPL